MIADIKDTLLFFQSGCGMRGVRDVLMFLIVRNHVRRFIVLNIVDKALLILFEDRLFYCHICLAQTIVHCLIHLILEVSFIPTSICLQWQIL